ncbi:hypothetical protein [Rhizobium sullae]|uniref:hypothetical protein n=1 Tax=Rhizobium sullae TaxID=50338 RepID=UPI001051EC15|nr:hypothetical protein [Rhizobium sullae]
MVLEVIKKGGAKLPFNEVLPRNDLREGSLLTKKATLHGKRQPLIAPAQYISENISIANPIYIDIFISIFRTVE